MGRMLLLATVCTAAAFSATVDGRVVNSFTGEGVPGVTVSLAKAGATAYSAVTDDQGRFRIADVPEGTYTPTYQRKSGYPIPTGLLPSEVPFKIGADGHDVHLEAKLPPSGKISGRVLDRAGTPVPHAMVRLSMESTRMKLTQPRAADSEGRYSFEGLPFHGSYTVSAIAPASWKPPEPVDGQRMGWSQTYYPGVTDPDAAAHIELPPSGELWNVDIAIAAVPVWHLRGTVVDARGDPRPRASLRLSGDLLPKMMNAKDDGTFEFDPLPDGVYRLTAISVPADVTLRSEQEVRVAGGDRDIKVPVFAPFPLEGKITVQRPDGTPAPKLPLVRAGQDVGTPDESGSFTIGNLYPGSYQIGLASIPNGFYLDSIALGGSEAPSEQVQVLSGGAPLTIALKYGGGTVRGTFEDCGGCVVLLVPADGRVPNRSFIRSALSSANGAFELLSVRPGEYYALALPPDSYLNIYLNITALDGYLQRAAVITVLDNETVKAEIPILR